MKITRLPLSKECFQTFLFPSGGFRLRRRISPNDREGGGPKPRRNRIITSSEAESVGTDPTNNSILQASLRGAKKLLHSVL